MASLMLFTIPFLLNIMIVEANVTSVSRSNVFLSRKRRYLSFPEGSNLVITLSLTKPLMQVQPKGWNIVVECDVPASLPSDTRLFKKKIKRHARERRDLFSQLELALSQIGLNGGACVKRIMCEVLSYRNSKGKSLTKDLVYAIFAYPDDIMANDEDECKKVSQTCPVPLLGYLMGSLGYWEM